MFKLKKIIFSLSSFIFLFFPLIIQAQTPLPTTTQTSCKWFCDDNPTLSADAYCKKINSNFVAGSQCLAQTGPANCGMYTKAVCCCSPAGSIVNLAPPIKAQEAPKYKIPELQVNIPNINFSEVNCTNTEGGGFSCSISWIGDYISAIYNYGINIAGILAAIMLMAGGLVWLTSGGDASKVSKAKSLIGGSITGLVILFSTYMILYEINPELTKLKSISIIAPKDIPLEGAEGDISFDNSSASKTGRLKTDYIIIHTAAGVTTRDSIDKYHRSLGWNGIGYNVYIERNGAVVMGRGEDAIGAHAVNYNSNSLGISYSGCADWKTRKSMSEAVNKGTITQVQLDALVATIKKYQQKYNIPTEKVLGHSELGVSKACPCIPMNELRAMLR